MRRIHDLRCKVCGLVERGVMLEGKSYPPCRCGGARTWVPFVPATDVYGSRTYSRALGREFGSTRETERYMRRMGYEPAGDLVRGGRELPKLANKPRPARDLAQRAFRAAVGRHADDIRRCGRKSALRRLLP